MSQSEEVIEIRMGNLVPSLALFGTSLIVFGFIGTFATAHHQFVTIAVGGVLLSLSAFLFYEWNKLCRLVHELAIQSTTAEIGRE